MGERAALPATNLHSLPYLLQKTSATACFSAISMMAKSSHIPPVRCNTEASGVGNIVEKGCKPMTWMGFVLCRKRGDTPALVVLLTPFDRKLIDERSVGFNLSYGNIAG